MTTTTATPVLLTNLPTTELHTGDVVLTHGMRVRLGERNERQYSRDDLPVVWFAGTVENVEDVRAAGIVPVSWLIDWSGAGEIVRRDAWTIQGNALARWTVERTA